MKHRGTIEDSTSPGPSLQRRGNLIDSHSRKVAILTPPYKGGGKFLPVHEASGAPSKTLPPLAPPYKGGEKKVVAQFDMTVSYLLKQAPKKRGPDKKRHSNGATTESFVSLTSARPCDSVVRSHSRHESILGFLSARPHFVLVFHDEKSVPPDCSGCQWSAWILMADYRLHHPEVLYVASV